MTEPEEPREPDGPEEDEAPQEPFLFRVVRSAIAPAVLDDGGRDAPLSRRGRILFWATVIVLIVAIAILFVITLAGR